MGSLRHNNVSKYLATLEWGDDVKMYSIDGPSELLRVNLKPFSTKTYNPRPELKGTELMWWVRMYLRERIMTKYTRPLLLRLEQGGARTVLVFVQSFHWKNVLFQLASPTKDEEWQYYFGAFRNLSPAELTVKIKKEQPVLYKYWKLHSRFYR